MRLIALFCAAAMLVACANEPRTPSATEATAETQPGSAPEQHTATHTDGPTPATPGATHSSTPTASTTTGTGDPTTPGTGPRPDPLAERYDRGLPATISCIDQCRRQYTSVLATFGQGLEDDQVNLSQVSPWSETDFNAYLGKYSGSLDGEVKELFFRNQSNRLLGTLKWEREVATPDGDFNTVNGQATMVYSKLDGSTLRWPALAGIRCQQGQFVQWQEGSKNMKGIILFREGERLPFVLLTRTAQ